MTIVAHRWHDFSYGHRVCGHENKCAYIHGHNGRVTFHCRCKALDSVGRVIDFSVIKSTLCQWVEENWDHRFLAWEQDTPMQSLTCKLEDTILEDSIIWVPFNPTAENMAEYLLRTIGPIVLKDTGVTLFRVDMMETRKCGVTVEL